MMLQSNAAGRAFTPNGLEAFRPKVKTLAGMRGLGVMTQEEALAQLQVEAQAYDWRTAPAVFAPTKAWTAYYGPSGYYTEAEAPAKKAENVGDSGGGNGGGGTVNWDTYQPGARTPLMQIPAEDCSPSDVGCVMRNAQRQQANMALNAVHIQAFNLDVCEANRALNPGLASSCGQYRGTIVVPAAPGVPQLAARQPDTSVGVPVVPAWTPQQVASSITNQPNQSVPPRGQPGEVRAPSVTETALERLRREALEREAAAREEAAGRDAGTGGGFSLADAGGKILGLEPMTLAIIAAMGVGALMLLKK